MSQSEKKIFRKEYNQLKKVLKKIWAPGKVNEYPSLALQPVRRQPSGLPNEHNPGNYSR